MAPSNTDAFFGRVADIFKPEELSRAKIAVEAWLSFMRAEVAEEAARPGPGSFKEDLRELAAAAARLSRSTTVARVLLSRIAQVRGVDLAALGDLAGDLGAMAESIPVPKGGRAPKPKGLAVFAAAEVAQAALDRPHLRHGALVREFGSTRFQRLAESMCEAIAAGDPDQISDMRDQIRAYKSGELVPLSPRDILLKGASPQQ